MDLGNQEYQPTNIASGVPQAFAAGAGAVPDLSARLTQLLTSAMGERGAAQRTMYSEGQQNKRTGLTLGLSIDPKTGEPVAPKGMSFEEALKVGGKAAKEAGGNTSFRIKTSEGHVIDWKGEKISKFDIVEKATMETEDWAQRQPSPPTEAEKKQHMYEMIQLYMVAMDNPELLKQAAEAPKPSGWGQFAAGAANYLGKGISAVGGMLGNASPAFAAGAGIPTRAASDAGMSNVAAQARARLAAMRGQTQ